MSYDLNDRINKFTEIVLQDAIKERDEILAEIQKIKESKISKAELDILEEVYHHIHDEITKTQDEYKQLLSKQIFEHKRKLLLRRDEILNHVFDEVKNKLIAFTKSDEYFSYLESTLKKAMQSIQSKEITIYIKPDDTQYSEKLVAVCAPLSCKVVSSNDIKIGGLIVNSYSDHIFIDETFDERFLSQRQEFILKTGLAID